MHDSFYHVFKKEEILGNLSIFMQWFCVIISMVFQLHLYLCVCTCSRKSIKQPWAFILSSSWWRMMREVRGKPALSAGTGVNA